MRNRLLRLGTAAVGLLLISAPARAQGDAELQGADLKDAWETWSTLHAHDGLVDRLRTAREEVARLQGENASDEALVKPLNVVKTLVFDKNMGVLRLQDVLKRDALKTARKLLDKHNAAASQGLPWEVAHQQLQALAYEYVQQARFEIIEKLDAAVRPITAQVEELLPDLIVYDKPNDAGKEIVVGWRPLKDHERVLIERIDLADPDFEGEDAEGAWTELELANDDATPRSLTKDENSVTYAHRYKYRLYGVGEDGAKTLIAESGEIKATGSWFSPNIKWFMLITLFFCGSVVYYIQAAQRGKVFKLRKIAGLEAVDEAVGRATEMGRPILFIPGIQDMNDIQTVAGLTILGHVAKTAAEHDAQLVVPTSRSLVMTTARETVAASYLSVGRPDAYNEKNIYYVTDEQFGYVAAVTGTMVREKPAACIYMGAFYAESLILAETANAIGSIQIAGTAMPAQLPFFVAACDYTLIGEEFFAASSYLSGEPKQLGSLKGQDVGKIFAILVLLVGAGLSIMVALTGGWRTGLDDALHFILTDFMNTTPG